MQRLEVSGAVRPLYGSLGVKGLTAEFNPHLECNMENSFVKHISVWVVWIRKTN